MHALRGLPVVFERKFRVGPGEDAAFEVRYVPAAGVLETAGEGRAAIACRAVDDDGTVGLESGQRG